jgi:hypothetical protein
MVRRIHNNNYIVILIGKLIVQLDLQLWLYGPTQAHTSRTMSNTWHILLTTATCQVLGY